MDIKAYIASGILEQYVIGALSDKEMAEVEQMMLQYDEVKKEVEAIEAGYESLNRAYAAKAPVSENDILNYIQKNKGNSSIPSENKLTKWWLLLPVLGLGILSASFYFSLDHSRQELVKLNKKYAVQKEACAETSRDNELLKERLLFIINPESRVVLLKGTNLAKSAYATVVVNKDQPNIYLASNGLPAPPSGKQYQLWALKDGTPVDMGVFDVSSSDLIEKAGIPGAQAYAITLEKVGGSPKPTLEQMYVMGS